MSIPQAFLTLALFIVLLVALVVWLCCRSGAIEDAADQLADRDPYPDSIIDGPGGPKFGEMIDCERPSPTGVK